MAGGAVKRTKPHLVSDPLLDPLDKVHFISYSLVDGSLVSLASQAANEAGKADALSLYQQLLPAEFLDQVRKKAGIRENNRIYTIPVVMWLMIVQRLRSNASQETAVLELLRGLPASFWPQPCKRLQEWEEGKGKVSSYTGAYNKARQELPASVVEQCCDRMFAQLIESAQGKVAETGWRVFFLDGTSVRLPHTAALLETYPPGSNQHGASHWPLLRMLVAHDLDTGLAMRPAWGPMNGPQAVSEQGLWEGAIDRLPGGAVVSGDANFGVFSVAYAAVQRSHPVLLRLTLARARRLARGPLTDGIDRQVDWKPSPDDRRSHPGLPPDACVRGRLIVCEVQPSDGSDAFLLCLFTTLDGGKDELVKLYGKRWNIETDLRSLKGTLQLEQLTCHTPDMVAKEIDLALAAYNLVRAITYLASQKSGIAPRGYSFTRVRNVMNAFAPLIAAAQSEAEARKHFDNMMYYVGQAKLPKRRRKRPSYPRAVWPKGQSFPRRKE